jgi:electron transfer flavoprotein alpha subunit
VINAGLQLASSVDVLVIGYQCQIVAEALAKINGVNRVLYLDNKIYQHSLAENLVPVIQSLATQYTHILAPANTFGKNVLPRLAAKLNVDQIGDVIQIMDGNTFVRSIYAGNALIKVQSNEPIKLLTIRPTAFATTYTEQNAVKLEELQALPASDTIEFIRQDLQISARPELSTARVVIAGGRGLQSAENFHLLEVIAEQLNAAIGASRAAVDAGFVPNDYQVGQTGKVVAPDLYIAVGISGAIQHVAGMKDSKVIVAINKDADAPIFQIADYGLVGDLFTILPALEDALIKLKK